MKARALGVLSESYRNDSVKDMTKIYESISEVVLTGKEWEEIYSKNPKEQYPIPPRFRDYPVNQLFVLKSEGKILVRKRRIWTDSAQKKRKSLRHSGKKSRARVCL